MKRLTTLLAVMLMAATGLTAQNVAPRGLFKLQRLGYENGRPDHVPEMVQYKLSTDYVPMTLMVHKNTPQDYVYSMRMDEPHPYSCTGDVPVGENGRGTRIYDGYDDRFTLKWYNNLRPYEGAVFPMNEFITEYYDRKNMEPQMVRSIEMLQMKHEKATHRFAGSWRMVRAHPERPEDSSLQGLRREGRHLPLLLSSAADGRSSHLQTVGGQVGQLHQGGRQQRVYHHLEE